MRMSLGLPTHRVDALDELAGADAIAELSVAAETAGFDAVFVTDHPMPADRWLETGGHQTLDPFVALSFAAAATMSSCIRNRSDSSRFCSVSRRIRSCSARSACSASRRSRS